MSHIDELREERDRMYQEHNEAFQAWMNAEVDLKAAIEEEEEMERKSARARRLVIFTMLGVTAGMALINWSMM